MSNTYTTVLTIYSVMVNSYDKLYDVIECVVDWMWLILKVRVKKGFLMKFGFLANMQAYTHHCRLT